MKQSATLPRAGAVPAQADARCTRRIQVVVATPRGRGSGEWVAIRCSGRAWRGASRCGHRGGRRRHGLCSAFWRLVAVGRTSEEAALACGVSGPVGSRWFSDSGGMPPLSLDEPTGRYLSCAEREEIALLRAQDGGVRQIARRLGRSPSTISRELRRNAATRSGQLAYRASVAQWHAERRAGRPKVAKLAGDDRLREYVQARLAGAVLDGDGRPIPGPNVPWKGRRHGRRADRRWGTEQISARLKVDFPDDESMRISHEAIYQAVYVQGRGALRRDLSACLRTGRALRVPRARTRGRGKKYITSEIMISERPAEACDRAVPGHWEGDLIIGLNGSAIGTLVERTTRFTLLLHLPHSPGTAKLRVPNGPATAGHGAEAVRDAIAAQMAGLPEQLRRSLTWDQGAELAQHARLTVETGLPVYFCDPHSPPVAARLEREHERPAAAVLPQGHRPRPAQPQRPPGHRRHPQLQTPKDPQLEDTRRGPR